MLNEQQITRLLYRLQDPVLEASLEETEGILEVQILKETANIKIALADPAIETDHFVHNIEELLTQFGVNEINIELEYLPAAVIDRIFQARDNILSETSETKFLAIASGKGGVGKSTVSANLAVALAKQGKKVGLLDADIYGFSIPVLLGTTESPRKENGQIIPVETQGIQMISMDFFVEPGEPVIWRGPMLGKMIKMFLEEVRWGKLDYLLIDLPPGTGDVALDIHTLIPKCNELIVTTPHYAAASVASRAGYMAAKNNHKIIGVIENMSYLTLADGQVLKVFGQGGGEKVAADLETQLLIQMPIEQPEPNANGYISAVFDPSSTSGKAYKTLAEKIIPYLS
ncbi:Mrp/NBP35 family ATP-binding protein [Listeria monocytogenes]|uniref:Mrp/NBP35 family ATP-binding protein n=1 Tax=Listeria monocytogenes TaxID=1639 RepID=UPI0010E3FC14|nr:Mrp/NBP35 family ATP-binding protein [Listeria monocytogenes]EAD8560925.1 ATP-binding protein [Listeria monocytogenes]EIC4255237.1 Mrp/NBP35 family ATP-binding protein [Listeria monocytogenes]TYU23322.1 Mrp/NBP35 family ATP-binding protein [Listeria monocytogenes]TYU46827.1 Mrp/NBP35 family ATP-binding protein [Listeria monocytogenes]TYU69437.1 Mrp/NBP35 family ATP-binding protein [Listeria monocytogenes]